ncbi:MAG: hypothetical protein H6719_09835 [Sandaracinaceae bacterium]|nr:hypothetical protein [Sandaracinaceae bacterium]
MGWLDAILCPLAAAAEHYGATLMIAVISGVAFGGVLGSSVVRWLSRLAKIDAGSLATGWVAATLIGVLVYASALLVDPLLMATVDRPASITAEDWDRLSFFEHELLGDWAWPVLPLGEHPAAGLAVHLLAWGLVVILVRAVLLWIHRDTPIRWSTPTSALPWYYRWTGASTARRADQRFRAWARRFVWIAWPTLILCGFLLANESRRASADQALACGAAALGGAHALVGTPIASAPPPGAWVLACYLVFALSIHLVLEGSPPSVEKKKEEDEDEPLPGPPPDPLRRLGDALQAKLPGAFLEALEEHAAEEAETDGFHESESPLVREAFESLTGVTEPWSHQREVLDHLRAVWTMSSPDALGAAPVLEEQAGPSPIQQADLSTPHALVLAPEGAGRTTLTCLAALYVHLDRGATTLVVVRDASAAKAWARRLREALTRSSARWNVSVVVAGDDLAETFLAGRTPAVVVAGLEQLESDVLGLERTEPFFASLGLVVADDVDRFTGVSEMHLHMVMRRIWTALDTLHDAPYPPVLLATLGPSASGMVAWARHVLAAPMRVFDRDGAPRLARAVLRRRDLADAHGEAIPLATIAEACEAAEVPWHLRRAGDAERHLRRAETELGHLRRHHRPDPLDAEVVLIEGTYPDVRREAERLAHAGSRTERDSVVLVLAPPADEEMVLHEEAADAPERDRIDSLPRAVPLAEPDVVRQRHFDRALGSEQDVAALRERFGAELADSILERLEASRRVRYREVWHFDPVADDAVSKRLVRAAGERALGEPIRADCVSESADRARVVDRGTGETLREVDRVLAATLLPPGSIFEHPRGRYLVTGDRGDAIECEQVTETHRTTPARAIEIELARTDAFEARDLGGAPVRVAVADVRVREVVHAIRRYAPGPKLVDRRRYPTPVETAYSTEACVVRAELSEAALIPLTAALRMILPCALRSAGELTDVGLATVEGGSVIVFFDRTPGSSGFARFIGESALGDLLRLARQVLERLVGPVARRLHRIHDTAWSELEPEAWEVGDALAWLDRTLDTPADEAPEEVDDDRRRRVEWVPGEGPGDLGRLWISSTGRVDDLVWTRHRFRSAHAIGGQPPGPVTLDVAVERRTIAWAIRKAITSGASRGVLEITDPDTWMRQHHAALSTASDDLGAVYERLYRLSGDHLADTVLALVAGIPTHPQALPVAERAPIAAFARRRADRDAKCLLAWALLPTALKPTVRLTEHGPVLQIDRGGGPEVVDLSGNAIRSVTGDTGSALALSWGEETKPEDQVAPTEDEDATEADG